MGFKGSVESFSLADVFQNLAMNQQTGTLSVFASDSQTSSVFFKDGTVHAVSHGNANSLPSLLAYYARGLISQSQLQEATDHIKAQRKPVPQALIDLGFLDEQQVKEIMRLRVEEEVFDLFSWEKATFEFNDGPPPPGNFDPYSLQNATPLPISPLIMEAARRVDEWERLSEQVPSFKEIYTCDPVVRRAVERGEMEMEPLERRLIALMDGTRDVEDVAADSGLYKFEILNALAGFIQSSLIRPCTSEELSVAEQECARAAQPLRRIKILERILAAGGENARVRRELAELLAREKRIDNACIHFHILAELEQKAKREEGAMEIYRRILDLSPKNVKAHERLAEILSKRGQRKEAMAHYHELFETYKDQNHLKEARAAAACALDCDPANSQLRGQLIEMLLAENQKEDAARQYETLGDHLAKAGDVKGAADAYRRALQFFGTSNRLKKKLGDVMLSKEDRTSRAKALVIVALILAVVTLIGGFFFYKEHMAGTALAKAETRSQALIQAAEADEKQGEFLSAKAKYNEAVPDAYIAANMFSPFMGHNKKAEKILKDLQRRILEADRLANAKLQNSSKQADVDLQAALDKTRTMKLYEGREMLEKVLQNPQASGDVKKAAEQALAEINKRITTFEAGLARLKKDPNEAFADVFEESSFKTRFLSEYESTGRIRRSDLEMPLEVKAETDGIKVYMNGKLVGSTNIGSDRASSTFRYPAVGAHTFEFKRDGYAMIGVVTTDLRSPVMAVRLRREPSSRIDVRHVLGADVTLSGTPIWYDNGILVGASDGSLLHIREGENPIVRRRAPPPGPPLNKEIYGAPIVVLRAGKPDLIVYTTFAGEALMVSPDANGFKDVFPPMQVTDKPMSAPASVINVAVLTGKNLLAMPSDKKLHLIDLESGSRALGDKVLQTRAPITSPATSLVDESLIVVGCQDGRLYGLTLNEKPGREWNTGSDATAIRAMPVLYENQLLVPADDGQIHLFATARGGFSERLKLDGAGAIHSGLLVKRRYYCGTNLREGVWCADLSTRRAIWRRNDPDLGNFYYAPSITETTLFIGNDKGRAFAIDTEKGVIKWSYIFDSNRAITGSPLVNGKRVYFVNVDGRILGFDE